MRPTVAEYEALPNTLHDALVLVGAWLREQAEEREIEKLNALYGNRR